jgi:hypothetical protein
MREYDICLLTTLGSKIMYLEAFGMSIIVLNDLKMAIDLLEKRSAIYSSRYVAFHHARCTTVVLILYNVDLESGC